MTFKHRHLLPALRSLPPPIPCMLGAAIWSIIHCGVITAAAIQRLELPPCSRLKGSVFRWQDLPLRPVSRKAQYFECMTGPEHFQGAGTGSELVFSPWHLQIVMNTDCVCGG